MKKITLLLLMLVSYSGFAQFPLPYCGPIVFTDTTAPVEPITLVNFAGINNSTSALPGINNGTTIIAHEDYTTITGNVTAGSAYTITLKGNTNGPYTNRFMVFADWNQDGDFADTDEAYTITQTIFTSTGVDAIQATQSLLVPPTALTGTTRMRVKKIFGTTAYVDPCLGTLYGQVEDYSLTVAPLPADLPDYVNLQFPFTASIAQGGNVTVYGQVYEGGLTDVAPNIVGQAPGILAWIGVNTTDTNPNTWAPTVWVPATWNSGSIGNNDEYQLAIGATLLPGTYYYATRFQLNGGAFVYGGTNNIWNGTSAINGVLTVNPPLPPVNDNCSGATSLTVNSDLLCGSVTAGTVLGATASTQDTAACGGTEDDDVWFSFVATDITHSISLNNVAGSTTDLYHSLWTGADCSSLTLVPGTCSDPNSSTPTGLAIGQTYYLRVYSWTATTGQTSTFNVCIGTIPPPPPAPANDECTGAIALTPGGVFADNAVTGTTESATTTPGITPSCQASILADVWYSVVVPASGNLTIETQASTTNPLTDTVVVAFSGACGSLLPVGCDDDLGIGNFSLLSLTGQTPGDTLYVGVWKYGTTAPSATVNGFRISAYDGSLGNGSFDNANFSYFPNPVKNTLNLSYNQEISNVEIFNLLGQKVITNKVNANAAQIDMSNLSKGAYMVRVTSNEQTKTIKVIKE